ncbi:MAG: hypothetical protein M3Q40_01695 [Pseudomonadota bacterium]|nr:hypothetical protein [Pseudomonadota bacterium]
MAGATVYLWALLANMGGNDGDVRVRFDTGLQPRNRQVRRARVGTTRVSASTPWPGRSG